MLPIHRRNWVFADPAMDQSMREVGVSFHTHDLIARPAAKAHNVAPAMVISLISLAYVEEDGLLLCCPSFRDYINRHCVSSSLRNN